jgi:hypothetical protein
MSRSGVVGDLGCIHDLRLMYVHENDGEQVASKCPRCRGYDFRKLICNSCGHTTTDTGTCMCYSEMYYNPTHLRVRNLNGKAVKGTQDDGEDITSAQGQQSECS